MCLLPEEWIDKEWDSRRMGHCLATEKNEAPARATLRTNLGHMRRGRGSGHRRPRVAHRHAREMPTTRKPTRTGGRRRFPGARESSGEAGRLPTDAGFLLETPNTTLQT